MHSKQPYYISRQKNIVSVFEGTLSSTIRTWKNTGHGKIAIDGMSIFEIKNILRKEIVTYNIFFDKSEDIMDYLNFICPHLVILTYQENQTTIKQQSNNSQIKQPSNNSFFLLEFETWNSMNQFLIIFIPKN